MKTAQEMKPNSVALIDGQPWLIQKAEFTKSGRSSAIVKMKLKNLLTGSSTETVYKVDDKMEPVILDRIEVTYSYTADDLYVFMDADYNQYEINAEDLESVLPYIVDGMEDICTAVFFEGKVITVDLPTTIIRQVTYTEGSARGDTTGKVMKPAKLSNGTEIKVPDFCNIDDWIEIDTRTGEYKSRAKAPV
ncbi:elongation factor P [Pseudoalteromonas tunicata]|jgi:elongation factor P|uniref:Elongation factor P n=1 Tax=Pseudoalteromonas tunicata D2 TaxID=87626 RepID=A4C5A0_9GAMM|nr:elongation factor P [Pseudoalteromonas tunicata]ATC96795.1 elongation factor P [Pseudoalteromonas tunicata]AXT32941.1 elongation factor P [Pseudoalteromonas tunicata]EAR30732.1 elongation factor P [Pseudoalteromonas tunicata D2]MDP4984302.1 elongation factor P [Pseudoalteromonas tunicata]MDP5214734.1 elongation factor P [Pseudoalteromonas tunicata]